MLTKSSSGLAQQKNLGVACLSRSASLRLRTDSGFGRRQEKLTRPASFALVTGQPGDEEKTEESMNQFGINNLELSMSPVGTTEVVVSVVPVLLTARLIITGLARHRV